MDISFHENQRELSNKLKNNELDWVTCQGIQIGDLKKTMGHSRGERASKRNHIKSISNSFHGFSLGKNSSPAQREMAMQFIQANVNAIAQKN